MRTLYLALATSLSLALLAGCLTVPTRTAQSAPPQSTGAPSSPAPTPARADPEAQRRAELSKNDKRVEFRPQCEGLFIPEIKRTQFQGMIPVYSIFVLNNSNHRYSVKYDVTFLERTRNVLVNTAEQFTEEKNFVVRPGTYTKFDIAKQNHDGGRVIADVRKLVVLTCERT